MKKLISYANDYLKKLDVTDMALIKFCLIAFGMLFGLSIPAKNKKPAAFFAAIVFILTLFPVLMKFLSGLCDTDKKSIRIM